MLTASRKISGLPDATTGYWFRCIGITFDCIVTKIDERAIPLAPTIFFVLSFFPYLFQICASTFPTKVPISSQKSKKFIAFTFKVGFRFAFSFYLFLLHYQNVIFFSIFTLHFLWMIIFPVKTNKTLHCIAFASNRKLHFSWTEEGIKIDGEKQPQPHREIAFIHFMGHHRFIVNCGSDLWS